MNGGLRVENNSPRPTLVPPVGFMNLRHSSPLPTQIVAILSAPTFACTRRFLFCAAERDVADRRAAARFACSESALFDADLRLSRFNAPFVARERLREAFLRRPERPLVRSRLACRFVRALPRLGGGNLKRLLSLPWKARWQSPVPATAHHVLLLGYVPLAHEFSRLGARGFAFALVFTRPFHCFFFWHTKIVSPQIRCLDVTKNREVAHSFCCC